MTNNFISSDFNLEKIDTREYQKHIRASIEAESNIAAFGLRGTGKTSIAKQIIKELDMVEVYFNLSVYERVDFAGYPDLFSAKEKQQRFIDYILPRLFEPMICGNKKVVALLDEVDKADQSLQAPLLEFTLEKTIGGHKLPNLAMSIMTGNLISEGSSRPSLPLLDRTEKYLLQANPEAWLEWAIDSGEIHPSIYQFILDHPNLLFAILDETENFADPSPRGWHLSSKVLRVGEKKNWDLSIINQKISGFVGKKAGIDYKIYYINYKVLLPLASKIFAGEEFLSEWKGLTPSEKLYTSVIVCTRFATLLDSSDVSSPPKEVIDNIGKFLRNVSAENVLMSVRNQISPKRMARFHLDEYPSMSILYEISNGVR